MRICLISEEYPTPSTGRGGIGTYMYNLAHGLAKFGEKVFVISRSEEKEEEYQDNQVRVYRIPAIEFPIPFVHTYLNIFGYSLAVNQKLKKIIREKKIDLVEAPEYAGEAFFFSRSQKRIPLVVRLHTPHIITEEAVGIKPGSYSRIVRWMERETVTRADGIISPSKCLAELCRVKMGFGHSFTIIPNPIDVVQFAKADYRPRLSQHFILFVGKFQDLKNAKVLIQALPEVVKKFPQVRLRLIGSDTLTGPQGSSYQKMVENLAQKLGVRNNIVFTDMLPRKELIEHYQQAQLIIIPSFFENFPYTCLEAMSCGCPVIASRVGGLPEMIEEDISGLLFQPDDGKELAEKLLCLLSDPIRAESMGNEAALRVRQYYSQEVVIPHVLDIYQRLVNEHNA